jgi:hypothetical protein
MKLRDCIQLLHIVSHPCKHKLSTVFHLTLAEHERFLISELTGEQIRIFSGVKVSTTRFRRSHGSTFQVVIITVVYRSYGTYRKYKPRNTERIDAKTSYIHDIIDCPTMQLNKRLYCAYINFPLRQTDYSCMDEWLHISDMHDSCNLSWHHPTISLYIPTAQLRVYTLQGYFGALS